jgi:hypothetical protein
MPPTLRAPCTTSADHRHSEPANQTAAEPNPLHKPELLTLHVLCYAGAQSPYPRHATNPAPSSCSPHPCATPLYKGHRGAYRSHMLRNPSRHTRNPCHARPEVHPLSALDHPPYLASGTAVVDPPIKPHPTVQHNLPPHTSPSAVPSWHLPHPFPRTARVPSHNWCSAAIQRTLLAPFPPPSVPHS